MLRKRITQKMLHTAVCLSRSGGGFAFIRMLREYLLARFGWAGTVNLADRPPA